MFGFFLFCSQSVHAKKKEKKEVSLASMPVRDLKAIIKAGGLDHADTYEKPAAGAPGAQSGTHDRV